jgi:hypothetical protein
MLEILAGMLDHWITIQLTTYADFTPLMQDQATQPARKNSSLGFYSKVRCSIDG